MTSSQREIYVQIFAGAVLLVWFGSRFVAGYGTGSFDGPEGLMALGRLALWLIGAAIVVSIALHILFNIVFAIANGGKALDDTVDERDRLIELQGEQVSHWLTGAGFIAGMVLMSLGTSVPVVIAAMFLGFFVADTIGNIVKLTRYARG